VVNCPPGHPEVSDHLRPARFSEVDENWTGSTCSSSRGAGPRYHLGPNPTQAALQAIAANWRPYRTWTALLLRTWLEDVTHEITEGRRADVLPVYPT
jgi:hypothetical protein